jgi:hypothetical protein
VGERTDVRRRVEVRSARHVDTNAALSLDIARRATHLGQHLLVRAQDLHARRLAVAAGHRRTTVRPLATIFMPTEIQPTTYPSVTDVGASVLTVWRSERIPWITSNTSCCRSKRMDHQFSNEAGDTKR